MIKRQLFQIIAIALLLLVAFPSCQTDDPVIPGDPVIPEDTITPAEPAILLEKYSRIKRNNNSTYLELKYDKKHRLTKCSTFYMGFGEILFQTETYIYNTKGEMVRLEVREPYRDVTFTKTGNIISFTEWGVLNEIETDTLRFPVRLTQFQTDGSNKSEINRTTFVWENGNLIREDYKNQKNEGDNYNATYTYDDKKSPFYNCKSPRWFLLYRFGVAHCSVNNVETADVIGNPSVKATSVNSYNKEGFLSSRTGWSVIIANVYQYVVQ